MARSCFTLTSHRVFLFAFIRINKGDTKMRKQKIRNERISITEPLYSIAFYYSDRNFSFHKRNSKRAVSSLIGITNYLYDICKKHTEKDEK